MFLVELAYAAVVTRAQRAARRMLPSAAAGRDAAHALPVRPRVIATATRDGGFPPLLLQPVDFAELLRRQQAQGRRGPIATA